MSSHLLHASKYTHMYAVEHRANWNKTEKNSKLSGRTLTHGY